MVKVHVYSPDIPVGSVDFTLMVLTWTTNMYLYFLPFINPSIVLQLVESFNCPLILCYCDDFQVTGIEGNYRMTCERVLEVLRNHKESVMAVLEAFVYDPLLNWRLVDGECDRGWESLYSRFVV